MQDRTKRVGFADWTAGHDFPPPSRPPRSLGRAAAPAHPILECYNVTARRIIACPHQLWEEAAALPTLFPLVANSGTI
jgi:hypothetical protein